MIETEYDIFISYRRKDVIGHVRAIAKELEKNYKIFFDINDIEGGDIFPAKLEDAIEKSKIILFVIGDKSCDEFSKRKTRIDYIVEEIAYANKNQKTIIPILIDNAFMPKKSCLPSKISFLSDLNAKNIRHTEFDTTMNSLIKTINKKLISKEMQIVKKFDKADNLLNIYPWKKMLHEKVGSKKYQYWACGKEADPNYYLVFFPSTHNTLQATGDFLKKIENNIIEKPTRLLTILRDTKISPKIKDMLAKKEIQSNFYTYKDYYWTECIPDINEYKYQIKADEYYVDQYLYTCKNKDHVDAEKPIGKVSEKILNYIKTDSSSPVLAIVGQAGSGKTTFIDRVIERIDANRRLQCIFVSSESIKKKFENTKVLPQIKTIYDLYEYCEDTRKLNKEKFFMGIANGSISVIIDGLEEIIALFNIQDKFDTNSFFDSLIDLNNQLAKCKVIVTSREPTGKHSNLFSRKEILVYKLQGFDDLMVEKYLQKRFPSQRFMDKSLAQKHIKKVKHYLTLISEQIVGKRVVPYILDIISESVEEEFESDNTANLSFVDHDEYLSNNNVIDMIVYSYFFTRELTRQSQSYPENFTAKDLVYIVIDLALSAGMVFSEMKILEVVSYRYPQKSQNIVEAVKKSPLFVINEDHSYGFKYDFLYHYFISLYLIQEFSGEETGNYPYKVLSQLQNEIIDNFVKYFSTNKKNIFMQNASQILFDILEKIDQDSTKINFYEKSIYHLMVLSIKIHSETLSAEDNMKIIKDLFQLDKSNKMEHVYILGDFYPLDFRHVEIWNSKFVGYSNFFKSKFDETKILYSVFENMRDFYQPSVTNDNIWKDITFDETCDLGDVIYIFSHENLKRDAKKRITVIIDLIGVHKYVYSPKDKIFLHCLEKYGFIKKNHDNIDLLRRGKQFRNNGTMNKKTRDMLECILKE